ncbi:glycosyltransferase family 2 protein [Bacillus changyiensis]|uniref:glycosyltransferase family 2 protein n=1 Tax=Bacillus changyiensis TaxID=3004103 RepID=UPI0022E435D9|nr:glycosyltransferase family 2 protein [Bacillus changyiensis]MDA1474908.1 glycosyltransferase family 2 protein [Bacillus changyiensis]
MKPIVSIIIPVYNGEKYLCDCLNSVVKQTLNSIEVLIVDDGSTDSTHNIIKDFTAADSRIVPIYQSNQGPGTARNNAIKQAKGEFVAFLDSDDWVDPETYAEMCEAALVHNADIVFTDIRWEFLDETKNHTQSYTTTANKLIDQDEIRAKILKDFLYNGFYGGVWKMYRKSLLEAYDIKFPDGKYLGEDWVFNMEAFTHCRIAYYINKPFYHYRQINETSLMRKYNPDLFDSYINSNTLETYAKRWNLYDQRVAVDLARRKCYIAVNGCIQNEFKPGCDKNIRKKLALISEIVEHPSVVKAAKLALDNEENWSRKLYLTLIRRKAVPFLFLVGKILSMSRR